MREPISFWAGVILGMIVGGLLGMTSFTKADEWKTTDKVLMGTYLTASLVDAIQTDRGIKSGEFVEANPLFGERPSTARLYLTKAVVGAGIYWLADRFPESRRTILWTANAIQVGVVAHNFSIGMEVKF